MKILSSLDSGFTLGTSKPKEMIEKEKQPMSPIETLEQSLNWTGTELENLKQEHGVGDDDVLDRQLQKGKKMEDTQMQADIETSPGNSHRKWNIYIDFKL